VDYCAANAFLDAYAHSRFGRGPGRVVSVNWDAWKDVGMAVNTAVSGALKARREASLKLAISPRDGVDAFHRILASGLGEVAVFTMDLMPRLLQRYLAASSNEEAEAAKEDEANQAKDAKGAPTAALEGNELERAIAESWRRVLGRDDIGVKDNFFELGGDSLTALQALALLKTALGRDVPIVAFYEAPTVQGLALALSAPRAAEAPVALAEVEQRAGTRLEMMERRRRTRRGGPGSSGAASGGEAGDPEPVGSEEFR
jgi:acyl carrier protein